MTALVWLNGRLVPAEEAAINPADRGFLLGDGLFETMRAVDGRIPLLARHLARLGQGAGLLDIPVPGEGVIEGAVGDLLVAAGIAEAAARLTLTRGPGPRGLLPPPDSASTLLLATFPLPPAAVPVRLIIAQATRRNDRSPLSRVKALGYLDQILALREAREHGADDALLLNTADRLACATTANLFLVSEGRLLTPPVGDGALPGITRALVLELAPSLGLEARELSLPASAIGGADEVFLTSSLRLVTPVVAIDDRALPGGVPGPWTTRITHALRRVTGA